ncbi:MAG: hypothetical protein HC902_02605 [Calothrix sp. SM1_5_4]|nr:hypothetical protein [Calothrix sp. SM1_5_4]
MNKDNLPRLSIDPKLLLILVGSFLTRVPFLFAGYGIDPDAWRIAYTGLNLWYNGVYDASRLPGYPVPEFIAAIIVPQGSAAAMNLTSALLSMACIWLFSRIIVPYRLKYPLMATASFAFVPLLFLNSVCSMDFIWSFFFFLASIYSMQNARYVVAGVLLGLGVGSRISYVAALLPFLFLINEIPFSRNWWKSSTKLILSTTVIAVVCFVPVYLRYGKHFFAYVPTSLNLVEFIWKITIGPFGLMGLMALAVGTGFFSVKRLDMPKRTAYAFVLFLFDLWIGIHKAARGPQLPLTSAALPFDFALSGGEPPGTSGRHGSFYSVAVCLSCVQRRVSPSWPDPLRSVSPFTLDGIPKKSYA